VTGYKLGLGLRHDVETDHAHLVAVARENLGEGFAASWMAGQASTVDGAVARALGATGSRRLGGPPGLRSRFGLGSLGFHFGLPPGPRIIAQIPA